MDNERQDALIREMERQLDRQLTPEELRLLRMARTAFPEDDEASPSPPYERPKAA